MKVLWAPWRMEYIQSDNMTFPEAVELVRASSLFTTHTPVPAGHDSFEEDLLRTYVAHYPERLKITWNHFMDLGRYHPNQRHEKFSMSVEKIAAQTLEPLKKLKAKKVTLKMGLALGLESGGLTAMIVKGTGKANMEITIEWENDQK